MIAECVRTFPFNLQILQIYQLVVVDDMLHDVHPHISHQTLRCKQWLDTNAFAATGSTKMNCEDLRSTDFFGGLKSMVIHIRRTCAPRIEAILYLNETVDVDTICCFFSSCLWTWFVQQPYLVKSFTQEKLVLEELPGYQYHLKPLVRWSGSNRCWERDVFRNRKA